MCEVLVLLGAFGATVYGRWFGDGDRISPFDSCSGVGSKVVRWRLRLPICVVGVW